MNGSAGECHAVNARGDAATCGVTLRGGCWARWHTGHTCPEAWWWLCQPVGAAKATTKMDAAAKQAANLAVVCRFPTYLPSDDAF